MSEDRDTRAALVEGLEPVVSATPPVPEWESLQFEALSPSGRITQWWVAAAVAAVVLVVGAGSFLLAGRLGGDTDEASTGSDDVLPGSSETTTAPAAVVGSVEGRWILESWSEGGRRVGVEVGENTLLEPWIEFTSTFVGERDSFVSADGMGTAGIYVGHTGCDLIREAGYEYSAGFLVIEASGLESEGCDADATEQGLDAAENVLLTMLSRTDGMEIILGDERMEWYGSYTGVSAYPLVFRRDGSTSADENDGTSTTTTLAPEEGLAMRVYEVDGIEVVTPSVLNDLPEQATRVEFHTAVIDSGNGPELCIGGVLDSLPPQCSGPVAAGLDMDGWSEEANGVRWGERSVLVTWPPVDGVVEVVAASEYASPNLGYPPGDLPEECAGIELRAGAGPVNEYARTLGDRNGDLYMTNDGTLVLQVVDDPVPHREALAELGGACVIEVGRSGTEQRAIQDALHPLLRDIPELLSTYSSSTGPGGRVDLYLPVADRATARAIAALVADPTAIRIIGMGILQP